MRDIWQFQEIIIRRLLAWGGFSIAMGLGLLSFNGFWRGVGLQAIGWGAVDAAIALFGGWSARRRRASLPDPSALQPVRKETRKLRRLLQLATVSDLLYVAGGLLLAWTRGQKDRSWRGHGWGIVLQGVFLFFFDLLHLLMLPQEIEP